MGANVHGSVTYLSPILKESTRNDLAGSVICQTLEEPTYIIL